MLPSASLPGLSDAHSPDPDITVGYVPHSNLLGKLLLWALAHSRSLSRWSLSIHTEERVRLFFQSMASITT